MSNDQEPKQQPKKMVAIPADLYDFFEKRAARYGRPVETIIEAIIAARQVQSLGGTDEEIGYEFERRMNFTDEEYDEQIFRVKAEVRGDNDSRNLIGSHKKGKVDNATE